MSSGKRVFIGVPGTRDTNTSVWDHLGDTIDPDLWGKHRVKFGADSTSGHLDLARSNLLRKGRAWVRDPEGYVAQKDGDVIVETPFPDLMTYLAEDFRDGAGIVFSPTTSLDWRPQFTPLPGELMTEQPNDAPFPCHAGAGGFMVLAAGVVEKLKEVGWTNYVYGTESGTPERVSLLCVNRPGLGDVPGIDEDHSLMRNVADSTDLAVVCDPRILTGHLKPVYRPSWRPRHLIPKGAIL